MKVTEQLLVCDGIEGVHIDAIPGVVCEGYPCIDGGHGVLLYDGGDRIFSEEIVIEVIGNQTDMEELQLYRLNWYCKVHVPPQQNILLHRLR